MLQSLRATRRPLARLARQAGGPRHISIIPTVALRADLVQDLYIRELRNYKPTTPKASDAEGNVQKFSIPKPPPSPEEIEIANDLKAYEAQTVEVEGQVGEGEVEVDRLDELFEGTIRQIDEEDRQDLLH